MLRQRSELTLNYHTALITRHSSHCTLLIHHYTPRPRSYGDSEEDIIGTIAADIETGYGLHGPGRAHKAPRDGIPTLHGGARME